MADNLSIAFEIYDRINRKQQELIKKKTIQQEDIMDFTEHDFIEDLQKTVNLHTKNIEKANVIDDVYRNILKSVEGISSFDEITTSSGIRIPEKMILESINSAMNAEKNRNHENENTKKTAQNALSVLTINTIMDTYKNLPEDDKKDFRYKMYTQTLGKEIADLIIEQETIDEKVQKSFAYNNSTPKEQEEADKVGERYSLIISKAKKLGINPEFIKTPEQQMKFIAMVQSISQGFDIEMLKRDSFFMDMVKSFGIENPEEYLKQIQENIKNNPGYVNELDAYEKQISRNRYIISQHRSELRSILGEQLPQEVVESMSDLELQMCFETAFDENGKINPIRAQGAMQYLLEKERNGESWAERFGISIDNPKSWERFKNRIEELNLVITEEKTKYNIGEEVYEGTKQELVGDVEDFGMDFSDLDMELSEEYTAISDELMEEYVAEYSEELALSPEMMQILETGAELLIEEEHNEVDEENRETNDISATIFGKQSFTNLIIDSEITNEDVRGVQCQIEQIVTQPTNENTLGISK